MSEIPYFLSRGNMVDYSRIPCKHSRKHDIIFPHRFIVVNLYGNAIVFVADGVWASGHRLTESNSIQWPPSGNKINKRKLEFLMWHTLHIYVAIYVVFPYWSYTYQLENRATFCTCRKFGPILYIADRCRKCHVSSVRPHRKFHCLPMQ